jgi:addiction module RelE/StbE family toxin
MKILNTKQFDKEYVKLDQKIKDKIKERLQIFIINKFDPVLNNHKLAGKYINHRSVNITGDVRLVYKEEGEYFILLIAVGTHSQLYK